ncbi:MAG: rhodanese-like domain-containing protein [Gammaproteobacteria bacterium]
MTKPQFSTIDRDDLEQRIAAHSLDNQDRHRGFALVNVLGEETFAMAHIPGSINIPRGNEGVFERHFAKDKEIVVYCASFDCPASANVAAALVKRGFRRVYDYAGGLSDWQQGGFASSPSIDEAPTLPNASVNGEAVRVKLLIDALSSGHLV